MEENIEQKTELTSHEKKEIRKEEKEKEREQSEKQEANEKLKKNTIKYGIIILVIALIIFGSYTLIIKPIKEFQPFTATSVHWHANFAVYLCGVKQEFTQGFDFEHDALGTPILHTHNDGVIHIEGKIPKKEDIAIGNFFDLIKIPFSPTQIMNKKNGDLCNGKPASVHMYVNNQINNDFRNFILKKCESDNVEKECDHVDIKFE